MCQAYRQQYGFDAICAMPTNVYGPGDNYDAQNSHVIAALIRRVHEAKDSGAGEVVVWGSGKPLREFLYADDLADALVFLMRNYSDFNPINIGSGQEVSITELAHMIAAAVGFRGKLVFDPSKPDGTPRKLLDAAQMNKLGWSVRTQLGHGIAETCVAFLTQHKLSDKKVFL
jgi:GDP-L-fucose synthase